MTVYEPDDDVYMIDGKEETAVESVSKTVNGVIIKPGKDMQGGLMMENKQMQKEMTNADKIRSMTDEQLSVLLRTGPCQLCAYAGKNYDCCCPDNKNCVDGQLAWLQQEHVER